MAYFAADGVHPAIVIRLTLTAAPTQAVLHGPQALRLLLRECLDGLRVLALVARYAGTNEVRGTAGAAPGPRHDMVEVERHAFGAAVGAGAPVALQDVFPHLVTGQRALLIPGAGDLRVLHHLRVEADALDGD